VRRWNQGSIPGRAGDFYVVQSAQTNFGTHPPATYLIDTEAHSPGGA
jgi:hypothetical protein